MEKKSEEETSAYFVIKLFNQINNLNAKKKATNQSSQQDFASLL